MTWYCTSSLQLLQNQVVDIILLLGRKTVLLLHMSDLSNYCIKHLIFSLAAKTLHCQVLFKKQSWLPQSNDCVCASDCTNCCGTQCGAQPDYNTLLHCHLAMATLIHPFFFEVQNWLPNVVSVYFSDKTTFCMYLGRLSVRRLFLLLYLASGNYI